MSHQEAIIRRRKPPISEQVKENVKSKREEPVHKTIEYDGNLTKVISTGSTLLDLSISGGRIRGGGIPTGILVEVFGPSGSGKTVFLCELAGGLQDKNGEIRFYDPEGRINKSFASMFGVNLKDKDYFMPNTITDLFKSIRDWKPIKAPFYGVFADSLTALSTELEMDDEDKMGMRRAKEFSEECRKTCRVITNKNYLVVVSNQVRINVNAGPYGAKYKTPGGEAIPFYSSLRLKFNNPQKIKVKKTIGGKEVSRVIGVETEVEVVKSSIWKPYGIAPLTIIFDYGIDNIRDCIQYLKEYSNESVYTIGNRKLDKSLEKSVRIIEEEKLEKVLKEEVINLWESIELKFKSGRKPRHSK